MASIEKDSMDINDYYDLLNMTKKEFAALIGISPSALNNYMAGRRTPTLAIAERFRERTNGMVTAKDFLKKERK